MNKIAALRPFQSYQSCTAAVIPAFHSVKNSFVEEVRLPDKKGQLLGMSMFAPIH